MTTTRHVLAPIEPPFPPEVEGVLARYPKDRDGNLISLFRVFANSQRFLTSKGALNLLDKDSPLSLREREIVILRVTANNDCEYEWGVHVTGFAQAAKFSDAQVAATRLGSSHEDCWSEREQVLIECVDQLCNAAKIEDSVYVQFQRHWDLEQQLEIMALCGNYHLISFVANSARIDNEPAGARFPADQ